MKPLRVVLAGIGGYGQVYVRGLLDGARERTVLAGAVDPYPAGQGYERLKAEGIPIYASLEDFYAVDHADLALLSTPIPFHAEQARYCLAQGSHVLVEKPIAPTLEEARTMVRARDEAGRVLVVGYQWCFDDAMMRLKAAVDAGRYGAPKDLRAIVLWPRDEAYYRRGTGWAGKRYTPDGRPIFDSVASNATAHYLLNMLWQAGCGDGVGIADVQARVARANDIETYDSICLRVGLTNGATIAFAASHAIAREELQNPMLRYTFEGADVRFGGPGISGTSLVAALPDGTREDLGVVAPDEAGLRKVWRTVDVIWGQMDNPCPAELAMAHTAVMEAVNRQMGAETPRFDAARVRVQEGLHWVPGLADTMTRFYETLEMTDAL